MRAWAFVVALTWVTWPVGAAAQYPPAPQPQPLPPPAQPYPAQYPQPYPAPPQPPPQPYPPQPYPQPAPAPAQPYPQPYPQQPFAPYGQPPAPVYGAQPAPYSAPLAPVLPPPNRYRSPGEMAYLFGVGLAYGVGTGVWIDALGKVNDPGIAFLPALALGAGVPIGLYVWDQQQEFERGVPSSIATGLLLGGIEGIAIDGLQWQLTGNGGPNTWSFSTWTTVTFVAATAGGVGGYAFGEWFQPDPRRLALIASGAGWGSLTGIMFGSGVVNGDWKDGAAVWGFAGYNAGILATGVLATVYVPSWQTIKYMWLGEVLGTVATTPVYLFYLGGGDARHGLIANAAGGLAGLGIAAALTWNMTDPPMSASWTPPFQFALEPTNGGAKLTALGAW
ncbi:MAG: hypothetical protein ACLP1X_32575 [Polyangiaceae bacterium]|jgi:hypothetical protein